MTTSTRGTELGGAKEEVVDLEQGPDVGAVEEQAATYLDTQYPVTVRYKIGGRFKIYYPLHYACCDSASLGVTQYIVNKGEKDKLKLKESDRYGMYPFHLACYGGASLDVIQYLVNEGRKGTLMAKDGEGQYLLHSAC